MGWNVELGVKRMDIRPCPGYVCKLQGIFQNIALTG